MNLRRMMLEMQPRARRGEVSMGQPWWRIENKSGDVADLYIFDFIDEFGITADQFRQDMAAVTAKNLTIHINSGGGYVNDGVAIYNIIKAHPAHVTARVESMAASIASVIVQAADERVMVRHSRMMIHDAIAATGFMALNAAQFRMLADALDEESTRIAQIYLDRTRGGQSKMAKIRAAMAVETVFTAEEAVEFGLADRVEIPGGGKAAAPDDDEEADDPPADDDPPAGDDDADGEGDDAETEDAFASLRAELAQLDEADDLEEMLG